jgi:hypothetical protein
MVKSRLINNYILEIMKELTKLSPELEAELPEQVQLIRKFYFQLSDEDKKKLSEGKVESKSDNSTTETKFCYECGKKISRVAKFCEHCGVKQPQL